jgi:hypothetical protein
VKRAAKAVALAIALWAVATKSGRERLKRARETYSQEVSSGTRPIQAVGAAVAAFLGLAEGGPLQLAVRTTRIGALVMCVVIALAAASGSGASSRARYGGLGATVAAFYAHNQHGQSPPSLGTTNATVIATRAGRVTQWRLDTNFRPRPSNFERLVLLDGINLPRDARGTQRSSTCMVWRSRTLKKLIGMEYAVGTTVTGTVSSEIRAQRKPRC